MESPCLAAHVAGLGQRAVYKALRPFLSRTARFGLAKQQQDSVPPLHSTAGADPDSAPDPGPLGGRHHEVLRLRQGRVRGGEFLCPPSPHPTPPRPGMPGRRRGGPVRRRRRRGRGWAGGTMSYRQATLYCRTLAVLFPAVCGGGGAEPVGAVEQEAGAGAGDGAGAAGRRRGYGRSATPPDPAGGRRNT